MINAYIKEYYRKQGKVETWEKKLTKTKKEPIYSHLEKH